MIRQATSADAEALARLAEETFPLACPPTTSADDIAAFIRTQLSVGRFAEYLADPMRLLLVSEAEGSLIGYTMTVFAEPQDPDVIASLSRRPSAELSKVYVAEAMHGTGVAAVLLHATVEAARSRGVAALWLGVNQHNARANRFYEKHGFRQVGTKRFTVGTSIEDDFVREYVWGDDVAPDERASPR